MTAGKLCKSKQLVRDFIFDSLYHPSFGYFSRNVSILNLAEPINFSNLSGMREYQEKIASMYEWNASSLDNFQQLWHTPSEVFKVLFLVISAFLWKCTCKIYH